MNRLIPAIPWLRWALLASLMGNLLALVLFFSTSYQPEDLLDNCMALVKETRGIADRAIKNGEDAVEVGKQAVSVAEETQGIAQACVDQLKQSEAALKHLRGETE